MIIIMMTMTMTMTMTMMMMMRDDDEDDDDDDDDKRMPYKLVDTGDFCRATQCNFCSAEVATSKSRV